MPLCPACHQMVVSLPHPRCPGAQRAAQPPPRGGVAVLPAGAVPSRAALAHVTPQQRALPAAGPVIAGGTIHDANGPFHGWTEIGNIAMLGGPARPRAAGPFTLIQIPIVTHMLHTVQRAINLAIATLRATPVIGGPGYPPPPTPGRPGGPAPPPPPRLDPRTLLFLRFFGPCTQARVNTVLDGFTTMSAMLFGARGQNATGLAVLNESATGNNNMAETFRRSIWRPASGHIVLIVGSGFFGPAIGQVFQANDNTIGTLIHEFAHACIDASDVPVAAQLQAGQVLDAGGMPPGGVATCVVAQHDEQLVAWIFNRPWPGGGAAPPAPTAHQQAAYQNYPLVNADAFGQYALALLVQDIAREAGQGATRLG